MAETTSTDPPLQQRALLFKGNISVAITVWLIFRKVFHEQHLPHKLVCLLSFSI